MLLCKVNYKIVKTTFCSLGRGKGFIGDIRQHKKIWDLLRKKPLMTNLLNMYYRLIIILWSIFLTVPLVEISAHSGLNLTSPRTLLYGYYCIQYIVWDDACLGAVWRWRGRVSQHWWWQFPLYWVRGWEYTRLFRTSSPILSFWFLA